MTSSSSPLALALLLLAGAATAGDRQPVPYLIVDGTSAPEPLSDAEPDAARGAVLADAEGCRGCHGGDGSAPPLDAAARRLEPGELRLAVVDYAAIDPQVVGHAWYDIVVSEEAEVVGETRLTAEEIEDLMAWLVSLGENGDGRGGEAEGG